jgi:endonuclease YncB( thermonuclease family)
MRRHKILLILLLVLILHPASSWAWQDKVVDISSGDAITVLHDGREEKVFLYGIKCPRQQQNFGPESKNFTSQMVTGRIVEVRPMQSIRYYISS